MIVREESDNFVFMNQHDHAYIAGELLTHFKKEFITLEHYESFKFAVHQHDRAWIIPDSQPLMNDATKQPYTFLDYPERLKLHFYKLGIEQVDRANSYAAILCSMHYASSYEHTSNEVAIQFYEGERTRQKHLMNKLKIPHDMLLNYQLRILQFCDQLSLYLCMNKPGASKKEEIETFKKGFHDSGFFHKNGKTDIVASYLDSETVKFNSSPFENDFEVMLQFKKIPKKLIEDVGLEAAYQVEDFHDHPIKLIQ